MRGYDRTMTGTGGEPVSPAAVRKHYAELAGRYHRGANEACNRAYRSLAEKTFSGISRLLEVGAGSTPVSSRLGGAFRVACDFSSPMLTALEKEGDVNRLVCDARHLPYEDGSFEGLFSINLLEHVPSPEEAFAEMARVLVPGGACLAVTPNGDLETLLHLLERLRLKLPEGPHRFLGSEKLKTIASAHFKIVEQRTFLAFPVGPPPCVDAVDKVVHAVGGQGLFHYIVLEKNGDAAGEGRP